MSQCIQEAESSVSVLQLTNFTLGTSSEWSVSRFHIWTVTFQTYPLYRNVTTYTMCIHVMAYLLYIQVMTHRLYRQVMTPPLHIHDYSPSLQTHDDSPSLH